MSAEQDSEDVLGPWGNPVICQDLIRDAQQSETAVTQIEERKSTTIVRAAEERDGVVYRCNLDHDDRTDSPASVRFAKCRPEHESEHFRDWSPLATGRLFGPQKLPEWDALLSVFCAAKEELGCVRLDAE